MIYIYQELNMFGTIFDGILLGNLAESFVDNVIRDKVYPLRGSILYCDLFFGRAEHSGIYIGDNKIVHLDGSGNIETVTPTVFLERLGGLNTAMSIYVSCDDSSPVGSNEIARRAQNMSGRRREYSLLFDNCHQFTSGCITGDFENSDNFLWMLKDTTNNKISGNTWRVWNR